MRVGVAVSLALWSLFALCPSAEAQLPPKPWAKRSLALDRGQLRIDLGPSEKALFDSAPPSFVGSMRGLLVGSNGDEAVAGLYVGAALGVIDGLELGTVIFPLQFAPDVDFGDLEFYGRYRFFQGRIADIGAQLTFHVPTQTEFGMGFGLPMRFRLGSIARIDTGVEFEVVLPDGDSLLLFDLPFGIAFNITDAVFLGGRAGMTLIDLDDPLVAFPLGIYGGYTLTGGSGKVLADLTAGFTWPFLGTANPGDSLPENFLFQFGASVYLDLF